MPQPTPRSPSSRRRSPAPRGGGAGSRAPGARQWSRGLADESRPIRLAVAALAPNAGARRKLLVGVDHFPAPEAGSPDPQAGRGLIVLDVLPGGVGSSADLRPGDVILLALNGAPVATFKDMRYKLGTVEANRTVIATVRRDGRDRLTPLRF